MLKICAHQHTVSVCQTHCSPPSEAFASVLPVTSSGDAHHEDEKIEDAAAIEQWDTKGWEDA